MYNGRNAVPVFLHDAFRKQVPHATALSSEAGAWWCTSSSAGDVPELFTINKLPEECGLLSIRRASVSCMEFPAWHFTVHLAFREAEGFSGYRVLVVLQSEGESSEL